VSEFVPAGWVVLSFAANTLAGDADPVWREADASVDSYAVQCTALKPGAQLSTDGGADDADAGDDDLNDGDEGSSGTVLLVESVGVDEVSDGALDADEHRESMVSALAKTVCNDDPGQDESDSDSEEEVVEVDGGVDAAGDAVMAASARAVPRPAEFAVDAFLAVTQFPDGVTGHQRLWLVKWKGYDVEAASWEPERRTDLLKDLSEPDMLELVDKFGTEAAQKRARELLRRVDGVFPNSSESILKQWPLHRKSQCRCEWRKAPQRCRAITSVPDDVLAVIKEQVAGQYASTAKAPARAAPDAMEVDDAGAAPSMSRSGRRRKPQRFNGDFEMT